MDERKNDKGGALREMLGEAVQRFDARNWHKQYIGHSVSFDRAVYEVARVFTSQAHSFSPYGLAASGPGNELSEGLAEFPRYFPRLPPASEEVVSVIDRAVEDYSAFLVLKLLDTITPQGTYTALDDWRRLVYLELIKQPAKPRGASRNKYLARDVLIVGQIKRLLELDFKPTRNRGKKPGVAVTSACDIVAGATARCGKEVLTMDYAAVENIWNKRKRLPSMNYLAEALLQGAHP